MDKIEQALKTTMTSDQAFAALESLVSGRAQGYEREALATLRAELAGMKADAEMYRWLRELVGQWRESAARLDRGFGPGDSLIASARRWCADELEAALAALGTQPEAQGEAVAPLSEEDGSAINQQLLGFALRWKLDGDYLRCRKCERPHLAGYGEKPFQHAADCMNRLGAERKPWVELARILSPLYTAAPKPVEGVTEAKDADLMKSAAMLSVERAEFRIRAEKLPRLILMAIAEQFDELAQAARQDDELERRDVWRNAAELTRARINDAAWLTAAQQQGATDGR